VPSNVREVDRDADDDGQSRDIRFIRLYSAVLMKGFGVGKG